MQRWFGNGPPFLLVVIMPIIQYVYNTDKYVSYTDIISTLFLSFHIFTHIYVYMSLNINNFVLDIDMSLMSMLSKIDRFDALWTSTEKREAINLNKLKHMALVNSSGASTRMEGSKMTDEEVAALIENINKSTLSEKDQQKVAGYFETLDSIVKGHESIKISESQIKHLHQLLLKHVEKDAWHRGQYKLVSNSITEDLPNGARQIIIKRSDPGLQTEEAMLSLINWYNEDQETLPLIKVAVFVYEFLSIHPFQVGNGRLSRLLTALMLLKNGYTWISYESLEWEIESRKSHYDTILKGAQQNNQNRNVTAFLMFFLDCLYALQGKLTSKTEQAERPIKMLSQREQKMLLFIQHHPGFRSGEIASKLEMALPTVKKSLSEMVFKEIISKEGNGKATVYFPT